MQKICLALIFIYQYCISPFLKPSCRFYPTCSQYAKEAILNEGVLKGLYLAIKRLLCCHPFSNLKEKNNGY